MADDTTSDLDSSPPRMASSHKSLRIVSILTFIPAFPLCIAHGVLSNHPVPAVGLVPLTFSASGAIFLLRRQVVEHGDNESGLAAKLSHPALIFACDVILAAALMVVLVFTWIAPGGSPSLSMLAAYVTIPLLVNFTIHLLLALEAFYTGLAIHSLVQWVAWRTLPPDCPHCHENLRPPFPQLPWLERIRQRRRDDYATLFVDDEHRYRDEEEGEDPMRVVEHEQHEEVEHSPVQPQAIEVRRKKDRKGKTTPPATEDPPSPWGP